MELVAQSLWRAEFTRKAELSREQQLRLAAGLREKADEKDKEREERREQEFVELIQTVLASDADVADFTAKLDRYDEATVRALMENEADLKAVRKRLDEMLLEAHELEDGRKVFKTRDGSRVFDQNGQELPREVIDPNQINDKNPRWEDFRDATREDLRLQQERKDLLDYQEKLDGARERLDDPKLSKSELEALDKELDEAMPDRVKADLGMSKPGSDSAMKVDAEPSPASTERRVQSHLQPAI